MAKGHKEKGKGRKKGGAQNHAGGANAAQGGFGISAQKPGFIVRSLPLFAQRTRRTILYYGTGSITSAASAGGSNAYVFSANGVYDPDITSTGGQPEGFDQMMGFYNHYTVIRSRIRAVISNSTTGLRATVALSVSGSSTVTASSASLMDAGNIETLSLQPFGVQGSTVVFTRSVNAAKFQGIDDVMDDPNMRGDVASNPTEQLYFHINAWNPFSGTSIVATFEAYVEYDVIFHEPRVGPLSLKRLESKTDEDHTGMKQVTMWVPQACKTSSTEGNQMVEDSTVRRRLPHTQSEVKTVDLAEYEDQVHNLALRLAALEAERVDAEAENLNIETEEYFEILSNRWT